MHKFNIAGFIVVSTMAFSIAAFAEPIDAISENNSGVKKMNVADYSAAIRHFNKALSINPQYAIAISNRALAKEKSKKFKDALADYNKVLKLSPTDFSAISGKARVYENLHKFDKAIEAYSELIQLDQNSSAFYLSARAKAKAKVGDITGARKDLDDARVLQPSKKN